MNTAIKFAAYLILPALAGLGNVLIFWLLLAAAK